MPINLTQQFVFETDETASLDKMLSVLIPIVFPSTWLPRLLLEEPSSWDDGKFEHHRDDTQITEHNKQFFVNQPYKTFHGATFADTKSVHPTAEEAAKAAVALRPELKPTRKWIATLTNEYHKHPDAKKYSKYLKSQKDALDAIANLIIRIDAGEFIDDLHCEEEKWFDGSIGAGYRVEYRPAGGASCLDISMVHILYGK